jgi:tetratricopeptide (TPR) repeat protein
MTPEGFAAAATTDADTVTEADVRDWLDGWQTRTFVSPLPADGPDAPERYALPALLRGWLLARLDDDERKAAHRRAGEWLMELVESAEKDWISGLLMHALNVDVEARARFLDAAAYDPARAITDRLSSFFTVRALYDEVISLNEGMLAHETHPSPLNWLGGVHRAQGRYAEAEECNAAAEEAAGEADQERARALHGLASVAMVRGDYDEAEDRFEESLAINREIGDREGEAATLHQMASTTRARPPRCTRWRRLRCIVGTTTKPKTASARH